MGWVKWLKWLKWPEGPKAQMQMANGNDNGADTADTATLRRCDGAPLRCDAGDATLRRCDAGNVTLAMRWSQRSNILPVQLMFSLQLCTFTSYDDLDLFSFSHSEPLFVGRELLQERFFVLFPPIHEVEQAVHSLHMLHSPLTKI